MAGIVASAAKQAGVSCMFDEQKRNEVALASKALAKTWLGDWASVSDDVASLTIKMKEREGCAATRALI